LNEALKYTGLAQLGAPRAHERKRQSRYTGPAGAGSSPRRAIEQAGVVARFVGA
jgi:hypothetical protein